ncbi:MAG: hypothetical protein ACW967_07950 [Candidatus Hodarchaeales archaeon]
MFMNYHNPYERIHKKSKFYKEPEEVIKQIFRKIPASLRQFPENSFKNYSEDVLITPKAYLGICTHAIKYADPRKPSNSWVEVIGFLLGRIITRNPNFPQVVIQDCYPVGHGSTSFVEIDDYKFLPEIIEKNEVIVGWYHSHPNFGLFMSNEDYNTQLRYQNQWKYSIGLVVDPTLISSLNYGIDTFRLNLDDLKHFELVTYRITGNFQPKSIDQLVEIK